MLREQWPECSITYACRHPEADSITLSDLGALTIIKSDRRWTLKRTMFGVARRIGIGTGSTLPLKQNLSLRYDAILSIGGDNYGFMDSNNTIHYNTLDLVKLGKRTLQKGKKYVLWGASVGPFDAVPSIRDFFAEHLKDVSLITAREQVTKDYLHFLGCKDNVVLVADPAFLMEPSENKYQIAKGSDELLLAINVSPLSIYSICGDNYNDFLKYKLLILESIRKLLENSRLHIMLVPHVVPFDEETNDDYKFLSDLHNLLREHHKRVKLLPRDLGAAQTKAVLAQCDGVIAARMHCCIAALSSGVPTILIQYSSKALGMARYVYGNDEWCLHLKDLTPSLLKEKFDLLLNKHSKLASHLKASQTIWESDARRAIDALATIIE